MLVIIIIIIIIMSGARLEASNLVERETRTCTAWLPQGLQGKRYRLFAKTLSSLVGIRLDVIALLVSRQLISLFCEECRKLRSPSSPLGSQLVGCYVYTGTRHTFNFAWGSHSYHAKYRCQKTPTPANPGIDTKSKHAFKVVIETASAC